MNSDRIVKGSLATLAAAVLVYAGLLLYSDARRAAGLVASFDPLALAAMLCLSLVCYVARLVRFRYLVAHLGHAMAARDAFYAQFATMTMTLTPGKVGEVLKAFLARELAGIPVSAGVSLVFVERVTDFLAVLVLSLGGLGAISGNYLGIGLVFALTAAGIVFLSAPATQRLSVRAARAVPVLARFADPLDRVFATMGATLRPVPLLVSVTLALVGWGAEGVAFFLALRALGQVALALAPAVAVYAVSTIVGALAMLPGGLGLTEGSMMGILIAAGVGRAEAFAVTLVVRFTTLWFGVLLGAAVLFSRPALLRKVFGAGGDERVAREG